ncbi:MAG: bifunctional diguanylate cyclase/phosphodiesterase [Candidatus Omnitrophica bacterium]|nr:bifunctional diguanylate cyclase/phosphodiesterase [Candidatus Omnitrophota bacterium]
MTKKEELPSGRFAFQMTVAALLLTGLVFTLWGWHAYRSYQMARKIISQEFRLRELAGEIVHLDEVLTMSARMAVTARDPAWEERYRIYEKKLEATLQEAISLAPEVEDSQAAVQTAGANIKLVDLENRAFDALRAGNYDRAHEILFSQEYEAQKQIYADGVDRLADRLKSRVHSIVALERDRTAFSLSFMLGILPVLCFTWGAVLWILRRWQKEIEKNSRLVALHVKELEEAKSALERDIAERKKVEQQLLHDAFHDTATGLPNRALFEDRLSRAIGRTKRRPDYLFAVLFIDVDRFKVINDSLGHGMGDQMLIAIAQRLQSSLRPTDTLARFAGDKFTVLLEEIGEIGDSTRVADRIQKELTVPFRVGGREVFVTASIGIAESASGYQSPADLLRDAETAMYRAKTLGRARYQVFDPQMHAKAVTLLQMETDLRRAVEHSGFQLFYQPIVSLGDGRLAGFEALIRWLHPEKGLLAPADFLPLAEEMGLVVQIDRWVLRESCRQLKEWHGRYPETRSVVMSVNISGKNFLHPGLSDFVQQVLAETGLDPRSLKLEIPESNIMAHAEFAADILFQLQARHVGLSIDDFGTGHSSLSALHRFPIETLKIDRSFVSAMDQGENEEIIRAIVTLAHNLQMDVIAEGIETESQMNLLKELGCEFGQGYFFSRPIDPKSVEKFFTPGLKQFQEAAKEKENPEP